jgi:hypothetical protein
VWKSFDAISAKFLGSIEGFVRVFKELARALPLPVAHACHAKADGLVERTRLMWKCQRLNRDSQSFCDHERVLKPCFAQDEDKLFSSVTSREIVATTV